MEKEISLRSSWTIYQQLTYGALKKKSAEETIGKVLVKFCDRDEIKIKLT